MEHLRSEYGHDQLGIHFHIQESLTRFNKRTQCHSLPLTLKELVRDEVEYRRHGIALLRLVISIYLQDFNLQFRRKSTNNTTESFKRGFNVDKINSLLRDLKHKSPCFYSSHCFTFRRY